ncbi:MAG: hypothetical protein MRERC_11c025 [Mycoplasmataceae bacterium RC_NB112A]|nr:MAG: hypothetical protein MRERC_11c025 [Mycoplasmataceae bacterium RC_NB112A]
MSVPKNEPIKFYHRDKDYYEFTNFAIGYPINFPSLSGYENLAGPWATSEHAFQAAKFLNNKEIVERFRGLSNPRESFNLAYNLTKGINGETQTVIIDNWHGKGSGSWENDGSNAKKIEIMRLIVKQKIIQHEKLKKLLLETGDREIIEDTASDTSKPENRRDDCWGNAGIGKNWLGKILMEIRKELAEKSKNAPDKKSKDNSGQNPFFQNFNCSFCSKTINVAGGESVFFYKDKSGELKNFCSQEHMDKHKEKIAPYSETPTNDNLSQAQINAETEISAVLNQNPQIADNELDYYQKWRTELKKFTELNKIKNFKNDLITYILRKREAKRQETEHFKNDIKNAQEKNGEKLRRDLENFKKNEEKIFYKEQEKEVEYLCKKSAKEDLKSYCKSAFNSIKEKLKNNQIKESELEKIPELKNDWEKMKTGEINQPEEVVEVERKITKKVGQIGARKRFDKVIEIAHQALKSSNSQQVKIAIQEIEKISVSNNRYDQEIYFQKEKTLKELKLKLENYSNSSPNYPSKFSFKIVIPISLLTVSILLVSAIIINIGKRRKKKKI